MKYITTTFLVLMFTSCINFVDSKKKITHNSQIMKESFFVIDNNKKKHEIFKIDEEYAKKLKNDDNVEFCDSIFNQHAVNSYLLSNGQVLVEESGNFALYPSKSILIDILVNYSGPYRQDLLFEKNPYGDKFPNFANQLVEELYSELNIGKEYSQTKVLSEIDKLIFINKRDSSFINKYFLNLVALVGQFSILNTNGRWEMVPSEDNITWTPCLIVKEQRVFFAHYILEDYYNDKLKNPLAESFNTVKDIININL